MNIKSLIRSFSKHDGVRDFPVVAYWHDLDHTKLTEFKSAWASCFPLRVISDQDTISLLRRYAVEHLELYANLRLPAAKSDIARLLALYEHGGLYVDCHVGFTDPDSVKALIGRTREWELVLFDRTTTDFPRRIGEHQLINSIIISRPRCRFLLELSRRALANLAWQQAMEQRYGFLAYRVERLSGPALLTEMACEPGTFGREIRRDLTGRVLVISEDQAPLRRNRYRGYNTPQEHWSIRQRSEPLFNPIRQPSDGEATLHNRYEAEYTNAVERFQAVVSRLERSSN